MNEVLLESTILVGLCVRNNVRLDQNSNAHAQSDVHSEVHTPPATSRFGTTFHTPVTDHEQLGLLVDLRSHGNLVWEQWTHEAVSIATKVDSSDMSALH